MLRVAKASQQADDIRQVDVSQISPVQAWSVVTMPQEFAANAGAAKFPYNIDNNECLLISQAYTDVENRQFYRYFWRLN